MFKLQTLFNLGLNVIVTLLFLSTFDSFHNFYLRTLKGNAAVQIRSLNGGGTGFGVIYNGKKYIMTNNHICDVQSLEGQQLFIEDYRGKKALVKILAQSKKHDMCLVEHKLDVPTLSLGKQPKLGDMLYAVGFPALQPKTLTRGEYVGRGPVAVLMAQSYDLAEIQKVCRNQYKLIRNPYNLAWVCIGTFDSTTSTVQVLGGSSGSPVLNSFGNVVGIIFAGSSARNNWASIVPLDFIENFLYNYDKNQKR